MVDTKLDILSVAYRTFLCDRHQAGLLVYFIQGGAVVDDIRSNS